MTGYGSLFERLAGDTDNRVGWTREDAATASVAAHLARMLSTRAGSVQTLTDYGLPDLNDMRWSLHDALSRARLAIEAFIAAYEPRLSRIHVSSLSQANDQLRLSFRIEGLLEVDGFRCQASFVARLDGSGQVRVS
jgi:type VI secretion system protein